MATNVTQIKITLPDPLLAYLSSKAGKFGLTLSAYVKNLILNDVKDMDYPVMPASPQLEKSYQKAIKEKSQAVKIDNLDQFFQAL